MVFDYFTLLQAIACIININFIIHFVEKHIKTDPVFYSNNRLLFWDFIKAVAIISVIGIHAANLEPSANFFILLLRFAVPFFVISSGYLLSVRYNSCLDSKTYYKKIFFRIILPYTIILICLRVINLKNIYEFPPFLQLTREIVFGLNHSGKGNYYFIPMIIQLYLIFPIINKYKLLIKNKYLFTLIFIFSYSASILHSYLNPEFSKNIYSQVFFGRYFYYFCFGIILYDIDFSQMKIRNLYKVFIIYIITIIPLAIISNYSFIYYSLNIYPIIIFMVLSLSYCFIDNIYYKFSLLIMNLGKLSLLIYLLHFSFLFQLNWSKYFSKCWLVNYIFLISAVLLLSYLSSIVILYLYQRMIKKIFLFS